MRHVLCSSERSYSTNRYPDSDTKKDFFTITYLFTTQAYTLYLFVDARHRLCFVINFYRVTLTRIEQGVVFMSVRLSASSPACTVPFLRRGMPKNLVASSF